MLEEEASVSTQLANQSESSAHLDGAGQGSEGGAGQGSEGGARQVSVYCKELLMRAGTELSFEELRAERYYQSQQQLLQEKLRELNELKLNLEDKETLPLLQSTQQQVGGRQDLSRPPSVSQRPESRTSVALSPIQETSCLSAGQCSPLQEDQEAPSPGGGAVDPCDLDQRRLLDLSDVTSSPDFHSESRPLPAVEEGSCLQLGGGVYFIISRFLVQGRFSVYKGDSDVGFVVIKVDSDCVPWDFHQFLRLKNSSSPDALPPISCFLFLDGCITVYTAPTDHTLTELSGCVPSELSVGYKAVALLQLVLQLHSCRLVHGALQPQILICCNRGKLVPDWVFPVDWSSSVDLDLQQGVTSVQQVSSVQSYVNLGLLEPDGPPQQVDLVGLAETIHLLLTNRTMVLVKDATGSWTAEHFRGDEPCDLFSRTWRTFFKSLLNSNCRSSSLVLKELKDQLVTVYY